MSSAKHADFELLIVPHLNAARNLARWITRNSPDAEDLVQESYIRAFRFFDAFHGRDGRGWLLAIVRNTCLTWLHKTKNRDCMQVFEEAVRTTLCPFPDPERALLDQNTALLVRQCIEDLPTEYRQVIRMRELEEMPYKDIADAAQIPLGTVMSRLARGRKRLETSLFSAFN